MNKNKKMTISIVSIFIILLVIVGFTYAYFLTRIQGNTSSTSISVTTADLRLEYIEGDSDGDGEPDPLIIAEKIEPNTLIAEKVFSVKNTGNEKSSYSVILDEMQNDFERNQDLVYKLTKNGENDPIAQGYLSVGTHQIILPSVDIDVNVTDVYTLKLEYIEPDVDQSIDMNKKLTLRVNIDNSVYSWNTAPEGSLLYALKNNQPNGTVETIPGKSAANSNEERIVMTEDDYGISYVYRGGVDNNYLTYSNMCWSIVRVQGDGTIKLALADSQHPCGIKNGYVYDNESSAFIKDIDGNLKNILYKENLTSNSTDFLFRNSDIALELSNWSKEYDLDTTILVKTDWCNDISIQSEEFYDEFNNPVTSDDPMLYLGYKNYGAFTRLTNGTPSLKCNQIGIGDTKSDRYYNELGILSLDELIFAGAVSLGNMGANYLNVNANLANSSWTMSPAYEEYFTGAWTYRIFTTYGGSLEESTLDDSGGFGAVVRPSVVLNSNVLLSANTDYVQDGTIDKPYVIG